MFIVIHGPFMIRFSAPPWLQSSLGFTLTLHLHAKAKKITKRMFNLGFSQIKS